MRHLLLALPLLMLQAPPAAQAQVFVNIGIQLPVYPQLQRVPGYPVYYAPDAPGNVFFYDGLYWVFWDDTWYYSSWYNGPWQIMAPLYVPVYLLRVPVRYYRHPPLYFTRWRADAPPRWGEHWGHDWSQRRDGWNRWDRAKAPAPAPLPDYQRGYPQSRYPQAGEQDRIRGEHYRYQPRNPTVRAQLAAPAPQPAPQPAPPMQGRPPQREDVRRPERNERPPMPMERPEPRVDRRDVQPPMRPFEPEQRRARPSERPAAPEPRQAPQWQQPRPPDFQRQQPPPQRQAPMRAEPMQPQQGPDRGSPGPRRFEDERGRGNHNNNRGDERRNRD
ncbi:hypothetical protein [Hydrogenophaga sp. BPS33]|uniref:hypothetical protein n=1 Tax=Hydrogenophaga sp. BPS33 TaxID=2651974 RepID=UPI00132022B7|nr:hypothetical protein [Hydrogenophaga sp. BPS33]QHE83587.1 hypothetical protein F9K07_01185 [Hydrogenophaga sp. BPS33]